MIGSAAYWEALHQLPVAGYMGNRGVMHGSATVLRFRLVRELVRVERRGCLNQQQMTSQCAISPQRVPQIETGHRSVSVAAFQHALSKLSVDPDRWHQLSVLATHVTTPDW
jgi:hypothetical protein